MEFAAVLLGRRSQVIGIISVVLCCLTVISFGQDVEYRKWIDSDGHATLSTILGSGGDDEYPISLEFNSGSDGGLLLPGGWTIPQFESRFVQTGEVLDRSGAIPSNCTQISETGAFPFPLLHQNPEK